MLQNKRRPMGYHCERFDMGLLTQVVDVEVDTVVRRLKREQGVIIDIKTQSAWTALVCGRLSKAIFAEIDSHSFLPSVLDIRLKLEIERLLLEEVSLPQTNILPPRFMFRPFAYLHRILAALELSLEKPAE